MDQYETGELIDEFLEYDDLLDPLGAFALPRAHTALLMIDIQERLLPAMTGGEEVVKQAATMLQAAAVLNIPVLVTEQYPKGLGVTVRELATLLEPLDSEKFEKITYTALTPEVLHSLEALTITHVMVCGMETHVCVWQTVRDLLAAGFSVQLLADVVCSRSAQHRDIAIEGMRSMGAVITVSETALFDLLGRAGTPEFKAISKLVK